MLGQQTANAGGTNSTSSGASIPQGGLAPTPTATSSTTPPLQGGVEENVWDSIFGSPHDIFNNNISATATVTNSPVTQSAPVTQIITGGQTPITVTNPPVTTPPTQTPPTQPPPTNTTPVVTPPPTNTTPVVTPPPTNTVPVVTPPPTNTVPVVTPPTTNPPTNTVPVVTPPATTPPTQTPPTQPPPTQTPPVTQPPPQAPVFNNVAGYVDKTGKVVARPALPATVANPSAIKWVVDGYKTIKMANGSTQTEAVYKDVSGQIQGSWRASEVTQLTGPNTFQSSNLNKWFISTDGKYRDGTKTINGAYTYEEMLKIMQSPGVTGPLIAPQQRPLTVAEQADARVKAEEAKNKAAYDKMLADALASSRPATPTPSTQPAYVDPGVPGLGNLPNFGAINASLPPTGTLAAPPSQQYAQAVTSQPSASGQLKGTSSTGAPPTAAQAMQQDFTGQPAFQRMPGWQPTLPADVTAALQRYTTAQNSNQNYATKNDDWIYVSKQISAMDAQNEALMRQWMEQRDAAVRQYASGVGQTVSGMANDGAMGAANMTAAMANFEVDRNLNRVAIPDGSQLTNMLLSWQSMGVQPSPQLLEYAMNRDYLLWHMSINPATGKTGGEYWVAMPIGSGSKEGMGGVGSGDFFTGVTASYVDPTGGDTSGIYWNGQGPTTLDPNTRMPTGLTIHTPEGGMKGGAQTQVTGQILQPGATPASGTPGTTTPPPGYIPGSGQSTQPIYSPPPGGQTSNPYDPNGFTNGEIWYPPEVGGIDENGNPYSSGPSGYYDPTTGTWQPQPYTPEGGNTQHGVPGSTTSQGSVYYDTQGNINYGPVPWGENPNTVNTVSSGAAMPQGAQAPIPPISSGDVFEQNAPAMTSSSTNFVDPYTPYGGGNMADGVIAGQVQAGGSTTAAANLSNATPKTTQKKFQAAIKARKK